MKRTYKNPLINVSYFMNEDIITTSTNFGNVSKKMGESVTVDEKLSDIQLQSVLLTW